MVRSDVLYQVFRAARRLDKEEHPLPVNLSRAIVNAQKRFSIDKNQVCVGCWVSGERVCSRVGSFSRSLALSLSPSSVLCVRLRVIRRARRACMWLCFTVVCGPVQPTDLDPKEVVIAVDDLCKRLAKEVVRGDDDLSREARENATLLFSILARATLASKLIVGKHRLSRKAFEWLLGDIENRFNLSLSAAGAFSPRVLVVSGVGGRCCW